MEEQEIIEQTDSTEEVETPVTVTTEEVTPPKYSTKTLELADESHYSLESYENLADGGMKFVIKNMTYSEVETAFTTEKTATATVYTDAGEVCAVLTNMVLGASVTCNTANKTLTISLVNKPLEDIVKDMQATITALQAKVDELSVSVNKEDTEERNVA